MTSILNLKCFFNKCFFYETKYIIKNNILFLYFNFKFLKKSQYNYVWFNRKPERRERSKVRRRKNAEAYYAKRRKLVLEACRRGESYATIKFIEKSVPRPESGFRGARKSRAKLLRKKYKTQNKNFLLSSKDFNIKSVL